MPTAYAEDLDRVMLRLRGEKALSFLHDVTTQHVRDLSPGEGARAAFLNDKGRVLADGLILATEDGALVLAEEAARPGLETAIVRVAPLAGVEVEEERRHVVRVTGDPDALIAAGFVVPPQRDGDWIEVGETICVLVGDWFELFPPRAAPVLERLADAGATPLSTAGAELDRLTAGRPRYGVDVTEDALVNETPLVERAVSFTKGCYPGQESVARVRNLGQVRRMLRVLEFEHAAPAVGTAVETGGPITSAAGPYAFAFVPAGAEPGTKLRAGDAEGVVTDRGWIWSA